MNPHRWTVPTLIAASALFCAAPFPYQRLTGKTADWQAWWALGTFLIALIAALIAYQEYNAHMRAAQPRLIASLAQLDENNRAITLTNVGGGTAIAITAKLQPGVKLKPVSGLNDSDKPINLESTISMLEPQGNTPAFDINEFFVMEMRAMTNQAKQTVHLEWNDAAGNHYTNDSLKLDFNNKIIERDGGTIEHDADSIQRLQQQRETNQED